MNYQRALWWVRYLGTAAGVSFGSLYQFCQGDPLRQIIIIWLLAVALAWTLLAVAQVMVWWATRASRPRWGKGTQ